MFRRILIAPLVAVAFAFLTFLIGGCADNVARDDGIEVRDAVIRDLLPGQSTTVAYFTLTNHSNEVLRLSGASSPFSTRLEMHTHVQNGDMMGMRRLDYVEVPPQQSVAFLSGGHHLMAFGASELPATVPVALEFSDGRTKVIEFQRVDVAGLED